MSSVRTQTSSTTVHDLIADFAGRVGAPNYDETKMVHIHRRNRPFVWNHKMQTNLLDSILKGYYVPPIICCYKNGRQYVMEGGNRITTLQRILLGAVRELSESDLLKVRVFSISVVVMRNLTPQQEREMFRRLNKSIKVSDGQLFAMSEDDSPLVREALDFLNCLEYPLRARITNTFGDTINKDNDGRALLANTVAILSGILHGVHFITKSFDRLEQHVENQSPIDSDRIVETFDSLLSIFESASVHKPLTDNKKKKKQFTVGYIVGAMLYDILTTDEIDQVSERTAIVNKWRAYIIALRLGEELAAEAVLIKGAQNNSADKLKKICYRVHVFVHERRLATDEELKYIRHVDSDSASENSESDDYDDSDSDHKYEIQGEPFCDPCLVFGANLALLRS
jgi:hypothetical protein